MSASARKVDPARIEIRDVTKRFGSFTAVDRVTLTVEPGEFLTLLGPSGCGKTTLLRMLSGFETPTEGTIHIGSEDVTHLPPYRRNVNQVFQSYALFPHLSVHENVAFGLRMKKLERDEIDRRVAEVMQLVALQGFEQRRPHELSGGQRQRVALARAIVPEPEVLLLDEPLSALDAKLRRAMQIELKRLQRQLGLTTVFVTHDQEEALTLSDRIAVMNAGRIEQLGTASFVYHQPSTPFVADFLGEANLLQAEIVGREGEAARVRTQQGWELTIAAPENLNGAKRVVISIRPEKVLVSKQRIEAGNVFPARVAEELFQGATDRLTLQTSGGVKLTAIVANESAIREAIHEGDEVFCGLHEDDLVVVRADE
ncbi:spermidine/putrescine ABC transporter ATP-binding protein [Opitutaceae bacterium EW11]|nr:spermidine/putrescine ABC transporter ATP-binding protein [Opitutaceae bacterium EW11]